MSLASLRHAANYDLIFFIVFFAHCMPHRLIIHKPSFSASLTHERVPQYLILALCALAAPWCKDFASTAPMPRLAGVPFFQEAVNLMFDASGRLLSEPSLATAQALCLLEMHEIAASHSWTKHYRYFGKFKITKLPIESALMASIRPHQLRDVTTELASYAQRGNQLHSAPGAFDLPDLALKVLEDALEVHKPDNPIFIAGLEPVAARQYNIERECTRRCFWLVQSMEWINGIYTYRQMRPRSAELMKALPLPVDENSFELGRAAQKPGE